jgi:hypothetical protein
VQAGLAAVDARGAIDLARTKAGHFPGNSGFVLVNRRSRPGGIVAPEEEDGVRAGRWRARWRCARPGQRCRWCRRLTPGRRDTIRPSRPNGGDPISVAPGYDVSASKGGAVEPISRAASTA